MKKKWAVLALLFLSAPALAGGEAPQNPYYSLYSTYYYQKYLKHQPAPYSYFNYYYYYQHRYGREKKNGSAYHYLYYYALDGKVKKPSFWANLSSFPASWLRLIKK